MIRPARFRSIPQAIVYAHHYAKLSGRAAVDAMARSINVQAHRAAVRPTARPGSAHRHRTRGGPVRSEPLMIAITVIAMAIAVLLELVHQQGAELERSLDLPEHVEAD